jgi:hypothetical protein
MNTQLIYVSKETAQVRNDADGSFLNEVSQGIVVKKGDTISVQGVAINSQGVGSDVIEIATSIKDSIYLPNKQVIRGAMYINHNQQYTCKLPTNIIKTIHTNRNGIDSDNYGYLTIDGADALPFTDNLTKREELTGYGTRYYLGTFTRTKDSVDAVVNPPYNQASADFQNLYPNYLTFNFLSTDLKFEVDTGYDNPDNIANKITQDLHSADITPLNSVLSNEIPTAFSEDNLTNFDEPNQQFIVSSKNSSSYLIYGIPRPNQNTSSKFYSIYQSMIGVSNPFYWYYGSRLLSSDNNSKNLGYMLYDYDSGIYDNQPIDGDINTLFTFPFDTDANGNYTKINDGYVMTTNLPYTSQFINNLALFLHSQKRLKTGVEKTSQGLIDDRSDIFFTYIDIGRFNDNAPQRWLSSLPSNNPIDGAFALNNKLYNTNGNSTKLSSMNNAPTTSSFFNQSLYNKAYLDLSDDESASADNTIQISNNIFNIDGKLLTPLQIAKLYDINIVPVDTGVNGGNEINIGIVLNALNLQNTALQAQQSQRRIKKGNYVLVDFSFFNPPAEAVILMNPTLIDGKDANHVDNYIKLLQVGSPNLNLNFDGVRGKFNFQNLYWANYIGNPEDATDAVSTAGQEIITANYLLGNDTFGVKVGNQPSPEIPYLKHSQSGIGFIDIGFIDDDDNVLFINQNQERIDKIYENSLLKTLGFSYNQLINRYGLPDALFTERHYNSTFKLPYQNNFPFPLTNNPEMDTEKNIALSVNAAGLPMFNLDQEKDFPNINISAETSKIYAVKNPNKLLFPYWLIQSNIIDGVDFNSMNSGDKQSIVAVCNRAYISGNFSYSFQNSYSFVATKDFVISGIKTAILNPNLTPATIDDKTTIIYQIQSPIPLFQNN